jgi:hypothetical protein
MTIIQLHLRTIKIPLIKINNYIKTIKINTIIITYIIFIKNLWWVQITIESTINKFKFHTIKSILTTLIDLLLEPGRDALDIEIQPDEEDLPAEQDIGDQPDEPVNDLSKPRDRPNEYDPNELDISIEENQSDEEKPNEQNIEDQPDKL